MKSKTSSAHSGKPDMEEIDQVRVALIEDDAGLRECLSMAVRRCPALKWVGDFADAESALLQIVRLSPDVVVVDLVLPGMDGVACTAALKEALPSCEILVLTMFDDADLVLAAIKAGARGYLIKNASSEDLLQAVQDVRNGGAPMSPVVARKVLEAFGGPQVSSGEPEVSSGKPEVSSVTREVSSGDAQVPSDEPVHGALTKREEGILQLLAQGKVVKEIPDILNISEYTVRFHLRHIYRKFQVNNQTQAVLKYIER